MTPPAAPPELWTARTLDPDSVVETDVVKADVNSSNRARLRTNGSEAVHDSSVGCKCGGTSPGGGVDNGEGQCGNAGNGESGQGAGD